MQDFLDSLRRLFSINADYVRLRLAEKISDALSMAIIYIIVAIVALMAVLLLSVGLGMLLATVMPNWAAFICVALLYTVGIVPLMAFRRKLFSDGTTRIVTRMLVKPPTEEDEQN